MIKKALKLPLEGQNQGTVTMHTYPSFRSSSRTPSAIFLSKLGDLPRSPPHYELSWAEEQEFFLLSKRGFTLQSNNGEKYNEN